MALSVSKSHGLENTSNFGDVLFKAFQDDIQCACLNL
jgi:hypothetical protein